MQDPHTSLFTLILQYPSFVFSSPGSWAQWARLLNFLKLAPRSLKNNRTACLGIEPMPTGGKNY